MEELQDHTIYIYRYTNGIWLIGDTIGSDEAKIFSESKNLRSPDTNGAIWKYAYGVTGIVDDNLSVLTNTPGKYFVYYI